MMRILRILRRLRGGLLSNKYMVKFELSDFKQILET